MTEPGLAQPSGGATLHRSSPARLALAVGLLAFGVGDVAFIHRVLVPRYLAEARGRVAPAVVAPPPAAPPAAPVAAPPPPAPSAVALPAPADDPSLAARVVAPGGGTVLGEPRAVGLPPLVVAPPALDPEPVVAAPPAAPPTAPAATPAPPPSETPRPAEEATPKAASAPTDAAEALPDLLFAINATWLSPASRETLDKVVVALQADASRRVILSGHTDAAGPTDLNRALARARARRAARYLEARGIEATRVEIRSFGSERPADEAIPGSFRARNRRVEIAIE